MVISGLTVTPEKAEDQLLGRALKGLREAVAPKMTQSDAAERAGVTLQAWQNYEAGKRRFTADLIAKVTRAVGATREELLDERDRILEEPASTPRAAPRERPAERFVIPVRGRVRAGPTGPNLYDAGQSEGVIDLADFLGPDAQALRLAGESMVPYAEPGGFVIYRQTRWPHRGQGCVIETTDGEYYVKRYEKTDGSSLFVTELFPEEKGLTFSLDKIKGVYAISLRGD